MKRRMVEKEEKKRKKKNNMEEKGTSLHICVPITSFDWAIACTLAQTFSLNLISWILTCTQHEHYKRKKENQWVCGLEIDVLVVQPRQTVGLYTLRSCT